MNSSKSPHNGITPSVTLVITPYEYKGKSTWVYPTPVLDLLKDCALAHSIPRTYYKQDFYQDLSVSSRIYHLQTSPSEPRIGWLSHASLATHDSRPSHNGSTEDSPSVPSTNVDNALECGTDRHHAVKFDDHLLRIYQIATPLPSDGLIALGLPTRRFTPSTATTHPATSVPWDARLVLIGSRDIPAGPDTRFRVEEEMKGQLGQFAKIMRSQGTLFAIAAGWRERGYVPYADGSNKDQAVNGYYSATDDVEESQGKVVKEQFVTVTGWHSTQDYERFRKAMVVAASKPSAPWEVQSGRVSPDLLGDDLVWARRIT
jgi:hypothetical protein